MHEEAANAPLQLWRRPALAVRLSADSEIERPCERRLDVIAELREVQFQSAQSASPCVLAAHDGKASRDGIAAVAAAGNVVWTRDSESA